jgi:integrase/recombinase XerC
VYIRSVRQFIEWYEKENEEKFVPKEITTLDLQDWKQYMQIREKLTPATINKRVSSIKVYWTFLLDAQLAAVDITKKVKSKHSSKVNEAPRWLTRKEVTQILHAVENGKKEWEKKRDKQ